MIKKIVLITCLLLCSVVRSMDEPFQIEPYFYKGNKDVRIILARQCPIDEVSDILVPLSLTSKKYNEAMNISFYSHLVKSLAQSYKIPQGTVVVKINKNRKIKKIEEYAHINFDLLMLMNRRDLPNKVLLQEVFFLINRGADPHYTSLAFGRTPLMLAVKATNKELVDFFIKKQPDYMVCDYRKWNIRRFNIIYDEQKLTSIMQSIISYIDYKLKLETHRAIYPDGTENYEEEPYFICTKIDSQEFFDALYIDRMLEDEGVQSPFADSHDHPLLNVLNGSQGPTFRKAIKMTFARLYGDRDIAQHIPQIVYKTLFKGFIRIRPRRTYSL